MRMRNKIYVYKEYSVSKHINGTLMVLSKINSNRSLFKYSDHNKKIVVQGLTKGKGFCGVVKRYGFSMNNASHGNTKAHRKPGSIGMCQDPGRVLKGKKLPGRKGNKLVSLYSRIIINNTDVFVKGTIPGCNGNKITIYI